MEEQIKTCSDEQIENLQEKQTTEYMCLLIQENNNLKQKLKVTEEDRDQAKHDNLVFIGMSLEILKLDDIEAIKNKVKETVHELAADAIQNI